MFENQSELELIDLRHIGTLQTSSHINITSTVLKRFTLKSISTTTTILSITVECFTVLLCVCVCAMSIVLYVSKWKITVPVWYVNARTYSKKVMEILDKSWSFINCSNITYIFAIKKSPIYCGYAVSVGLAPSNRFIARFTHIHSWRRSVFFPNILTLSHTRSQIENNNNEKKTYHFAIIRWEREEQGRKKLAAMA